jgi:hypothetical protein
MSTSARIVVPRGLDPVYLAIGDDATASGVVHALTMLAGAHRRAILLTGDIPGSPEQPLAPWPTIGLGSMGPF